MKTVALIIAGGKGQRFWPKSRVDLPKQFLSLENNKGTMIQETVKRILPIVELNDVFIITGKQYLGLTHHQLPLIPKTNIILEPEGRNTAPAILLAINHIKKLYSDCIMYVLPCDHIVSDEFKYIEILKTAGEFVTRNNALVTIGVKPNSPNTQYGYIKAVNCVENTNIYKVDKFTEKPDLITAENFLKDGNYYWNAGSFVWKLSDINAAYKKYMPELYSNLDEVFSTNVFKFIPTLEKVFAEQEKISIDYGILEKADNIYVITGEFGWDDVGSWNAVERINAQDENGNVNIGENIEALDTHNVTVYNDTKKLVALLGVDDVVVVNTNDAILVVKKNKTSDIKELLKQLEDNKKDKYL